MNLTSDQYVGLSKLEKWYRKYTHQFIEISGAIGTGAWEIVQDFIELHGFEPREVMYLSYDQRQVIEMAAKRYHAYYINGIIYNYTRIVDFDTLVAVNPHSTELKYEWKKKVRKKIDPRYKLIVIFDSVLLNEDTIRDIGSFGVPVILLKDPMLLPAPDTYTFLRDANIKLREPHPEYMKNPIVYFAHKIISGETIKVGNYDNVSVVSRKQMNLYNLKSSDMVITLSDSLRSEVNKKYRHKILKQENNINTVGERMIVMDNMYAHRIVNKDESNIKIYLMKGMVGHITKINSHTINTKYVPIEFTPDFYFEQFDDLILDRHYLNNIDVPSRQLIPDETVRMEYAYALTPHLARLNHWEKVTMILDRESNDYDEDFLTRLIYTGITRATDLLTLVI